jgi:hydrogenase nickel incorporation protein HypA/HybF
VLRVTMRVGDLTGLVPDSLQFAFEVLREGTAASEATLEVEIVPATCYCDVCRRRFPAPALGRECPACGSSPCAAVGGREVEVASIEVE